MTATIEITFKDGLGNLEVTLNRTDGTTEVQKLELSGTITLKNVQTNDSITMTGACAGTMDIKIDIATIPSTPILNYPTGKINIIFLI